MPSIDELLKKQKTKAEKLGIATKKMRRDGPSRPWEVKASDFMQAEAPPTPAPTVANQFHGAIRKEAPIDRIPKIEKEIPTPVSASEVACHSLSTGMPHIDEMPKMARQNDGEVACHLAPNEPLEISTKHLRLLVHFRKLCGSSNIVGPTTYFILSNETGIPERSLARYVKILTLKGIIQPKSGRHTDGSQGTTYICDLRLMNDALSLSFLTGQSDRQVARQFERSSSNYINTTTLQKSGMPLFVSEIDLSALPGIDPQVLKKYVAKYDTQEALQDFVDRVAYAIKIQAGTKNEVKFPGAFMAKCYEEGVNVPPTYKSRKARLEEEALSRELAEFEALKQLRDERRKLEVEKAKIKFEEWLEGLTRDQIMKFESEQRVRFPSGGAFEVPASVRVKQLMEVKLDHFILETGLPQQFRDPLKNAY